MTNVREFIWRRVMDENSFEHGRIDRTATGIQLSGTVLIAEAGAPLQVDYFVQCDPAWRTRSVLIAQSWRGGEARLRLAHDGNGNWQLNGAPAPGLHGCTDVDLGVTPSTNALPVNRMGLNVGASKVIRAAWVRFPNLEVTAAEQSYMRLKENAYRYRSLGSDFEATIRVDGDGLPVDYEGIWTRIAEGTGAPCRSAALAANADFATALLAAGPSPDLGTVADDFDWLTGGWAGEVRDFDGGRHMRKATGEWWFAWVLEGRAMQDVWIVPRRADRARPQVAPLADDRYGSTIRWFDRQDGLWRIAWFNPVNGTANRLSGRREGNRITLDGKAGGKQIRWMFDDIRSDSFLWKGQSGAPDGTWKTEAEFRLRRIRQAD